jgi:hypothetical protein
VGPLGEVGPLAKTVSLAILDRVIAGDWKRLESA